MVARTKPSLRPLLARLGACGDARTWADDRGVTVGTWHACDRGDWLLWLAATIGVDRRLVVLAACDCAAPALRLYERRYPKDRRPREALRVARAWARGKATLEQVRTAAAAAAAAADAAAYAAAAYAAASASAAAYAYAYSADAAAAAAAADAAYSATSASGAARAQSLARSACAVRARIPSPVMRRALRRWEAST